GAQSAPVRSAGACPPPAPSSPLPRRASDGCWSGTRSALRAVLHSDARALRTRARAVRRRLAVPASFVCILAGGGGTRLWPLSRGSHPKQLLALAGPRTLIQDTVDRLLPLVPAARVLIITEASHAGELREQVPEIPPENFLVEP